MKFSEFEALAETNLERAQVELIRSAIVKFVKAVEVDLVAHIEKSAGRIREIDRDFVKIDDFFDETGGRIKISLTTIKESFLTRGEYEGAELTEKMMSTYLTLILGAMNSIIDRNGGRIDDKSGAGIKKAITDQQTHLSELTLYGATEPELEALETLENSLRTLNGGITVDLRKLIEKSAVEQQEIVSAFNRIDDEINAASGIIEENIDHFRMTVEERVKSARETMVKLAEKLEADLFRNKIFTWVFSILILSAIIAMFILLTLGITRPVYSIVDGLNGGADQVATSAGRVTSMSRSLAQGTAQQATSIEETSASLEEMSSITRQNAESAEEANTLMVHTNQVVKRANDCMIELSSSMEEISKASENTQKIVGTIDEIAFQTNLLALNAAVEAARAGEAGAGFAVVADEVRNLAMRAAEAAKNTAELIESTVNKISEGEDLVNVTNQEFSEVSVNSAKVANLITEISAASREQSHGIVQINKAVMQVDRVTQQNAVNAEESACSSLEMNSQALQMKNRVQELRALVEGAVGNNGAVEAGLIQPGKNAPHARDLGGHGSAVGQPAFDAEQGIESTIPLGR